MSTDINHLRQLTTTVKILFPQILEGLRDPIARVRLHDKSWFAAFFEPLQATPPGLQTAIPYDRNRDSEQHIIDPRARRRTAPRPRPASGLTLDAALRFLAAAEDHQQSYVKGKHAWNLS